MIFLAWLLGGVGLVGVCLHGVRSFQSANEGRLAYLDRWADEIGDRVMESLQHDAHIKAWRACRDMDQRQNYYGALLQSDTNWYGNALQQAAISGHSGYYGALMGARMQSCNPYSDAFGFLGI